MIYGIIACKNWNKLSALGQIKIRKIAMNYSVNVWRCGNRLVLTLPLHENTYLVLKK